MTRIVRIFADQIRVNPPHLPNPRSILRALEFASFLWIEIPDYLFQSLSITQIMDLKHSDITEIILKAFYKVYNNLGFGFLEKVYENALHHELLAFGMSVEKQRPIKVHYEGKIVGEYYADLIVNNAVIIELKAAEGLIEEHEAQLTNYLKATEIEVGLLLNFGLKPQFKRKVFANERKSFAIDPIRVNPPNPRHPRSIAEENLIERG